MDPNRRRLLREQEDFDRRLQQMRERQQRMREGLDRARAAAEARQGQRTPYEYDLKIAGQTETVRSFVPMETSACVGLADNDMEPTSAEQIAKAKKAALENDDEDAPPVDPTIDIVVLAPLAETACQLWSTNKSGRLAGSSGRNSALQKLRATG